VIDLIACKKIEMQGRIPTKQSLFGATTITIAKGKFVKNDCIPLGSTDSDKIRKSFNQGISCIIAAKLIVMI
jgi:hypothetical protein